MLGPVKEVLDELKEENVIEEVKDNPAWINPLVGASKENGKPRLCIDSKELNKQIVPFKHRLKTVEEVAAKMPGAKIFYKLDARCGFHQIPLDEESSKICSFSTPFGMYRYKRLPFGIIDAFETFQRTMDKHFGEWSESNIDDVCR